MGAWERLIVTVESQILNGICGKLFIMQSKTNIDDGNARNRKIEVWETLDQVLSLL